jgi:hypothetical protein
MVKRIVWPRPKDTTTATCQQHAPGGTLSLGHLPIKDITRRELEPLVASLDAKVRVGKLSWRSALNTWTLVAKLFDDACNVNIREAEAIRDGFGELFPSLPMSLLVPAAAAFSRPQSSCRFVPSSASTRKNCAEGGS